MSLLRELFTPDDFKGNPYGELTNQLSHTLLGVLASAIVCFIHTYILGEMPYRAAVFVIVSFGYVLAVEALIQGWRGRDSILDWFFVSAGAAGVLWPLKEVVAGNYVVGLSLDTRIFAGIFIAWGIVLIIRLRGMIAE